MLSVVSHAHSRAIVHLGIGENTVLVDPSGRLWILSHAGVSVYDGRAFTTHSSASGLPADELGAALIHHCICEKIPLPAKSPKVLQVFGDSIGLIVSSLARTPLSMSRCRLGIRPCSSSGSMTSQFAPSQAQS